MARTKSMRRCDETPKKKQKREETKENKEDIGEHPRLPLGMYFRPTEYKNQIKIGTRCFISDFFQVMLNLKQPDCEKNWFAKHPSFKHIFHLPGENQIHRVMGMWMLLLRTAKIKKEKEVWFVVNGVPIRYGIEEHALMSGFNCKNYPVNYEEAGSDDFHRRQFSDKIVRYQDVKAKLRKMEPNGDRLKMAVLFFLCGIVRGQKRQGRNDIPVEPFLLRAVDDLEFCKDFPWGRYTFYHVLGEIKNTMNHFKGTAKQSKSPWVIAGFIIPLELLAFEAIPELGNCFLEKVSHGYEKCPRMCKRQFKKGYRHGFGLSKVYKQLGRTKDIFGILPIEDEEKSFMADITEDGGEDDRHDVVVDSWMRSLSQGQSVRFDDMFEEDVTARVAIKDEIKVAEEIPVMPAQLVDLINSMEEKINQIVDKVDGINERLASFEAAEAQLRAAVKELRALKELREVTPNKSNPAHLYITRSLEPGQWLDDEVINRYLQLLKAREAREPKKFLKCHFFTTFFFIKLFVESGYNYSNVQRWTDIHILGYHLKDMDKIFIPIHMRSHWTLAVINVKDKNFQYLDSLKGRGSRYLDAVARYFVDEVHDKNGTKLDVSGWRKECVKDLPMQTNGFDCGMFMLKYIDFYSRGMDLCFTQEQMSYFRKKTAKEILEMKAE